MMAIMTANITPPFSQPYSIGGTGNFPGAPNDPGNPGGSTYISTVFLLNGGQGGSRWQGYGAGNPGTVGSGTALYSTTNQGQIFGFGKLGPATQDSGIISGGLKDQAGKAGALVVFDNS